MGNSLVIQNTGSSDVIKIRAHHLLCMQGFQGYGYSPEFERNMGEVIDYLKIHHDSRLKVVADADIICQECPHLEDGRCDKSHSFNPSDMDLMVLKKLGMGENKIETARNLFDQVNKLLSVDDIQDICGGCSWKDKCRWYVSGLEK